MQLSPGVAGRVERADIDYLRTRVGAWAALPGNPAGAEVREVGTATAFLVDAVPNPLFNHVMGLTSADVAVLPELADWYGGHGIPLRVDVTPAQADPDLFTALAAAGLHQTGFYAGLYASPAEVSPGDVSQGDDIVVAEAEPAEFADTYVRGFGFPAHRRTALATSITVLAGRPDVRLRRALVGGATAGVGLLFLAGGTAYLATAATLPEDRGRGVQTALVRDRAALAGENGCDLLVGHTGVGSVSHRTMERCGMRLAHTKALWSQV
jgi:ribosomal protein S18 acetylase RimI-like enzyme